MTDRPGNSALTSFGLGWMAKVTTMAQDRYNRAVEALQSATGSRLDRNPVATGVELAANWQAAKKEAIKTQVSGFQADYPLEAARFEKELKDIFDNQLNRDLSSKLANIDKSRPNENRAEVLEIVAEYSKIMDRFFDGWKESQDVLYEIAEAKRSIRRALDDIEREYRIIEPFYYDPSANENDPSARSGAPVTAQPVPGPQPRSDLIDVKNEDDIRMQGLLRTFLSLSGNQGPAPELKEVVDSMCRQIETKLDKIVDPTVPGNTAASSDAPPPPRTGLENLDLHTKLFEFFKEERNITIFRRPDEQRAEAIQDLREHIDVLMSIADVDSKGAPLPQAPVSGQASGRRFVEEEQARLRNDLEAEAGRLLSDLQSPAVPNPDPKMISGFRKILEGVVKSRFLDLRNRDVPEAEALEITRSVTSQMERLILRLSANELRGLPRSSPVYTRYYRDLNRLEAQLLLEGN